MSADNCIAILETKKDKPVQGTLWADPSRPYEYRVIYCQGIDNIYGDWDEETFNYKPNKKAILETFKNALVFDDPDVAFGYAVLVSKDYTTLEYGIMSIVDFAEKTFKEITE